MPSLCSGALEVPAGPVASSWPPALPRQRVPVAVREGCAAPVSIPALYPNSPARKHMVIAGTQRLSDIAVPWGQPSTSAAVSWWEGEGRVAVERGSIASAQNTRKRAKWQTAHRAPRLSCQGTSLSLQNPWEQRVPLTLKTPEPNPKFLRLPQKLPQ